MRRIKAGPCPLTEFPLSCLALPVCIMPPRRVLASCCLFACFRSLLIYIRKIRTCQYLLPVSFFPNPPSPCPDDSDGSNPLRYGRDRYSMYLNYIHPWSCPIPQKKPGLPDPFDSLPLPSPRLHPATYASPGAEWLPLGTKEARRGSRVTGREKKDTCCKKRPSQGGALRDARLGNSRGPVVSRKRRGALAPSDFARLKT
ncbi:hypothetical protein B0J15DRAFT_14768 [Fusarium solani]|uniref:Uncharacterized protein n=1 Tax=Fusarium solani TaxID=169388 RepID=A0A9P9L7N4_FUSSL|nr:uncharacterized protein B0J15DRAFT_14768 [Fusarium solani]KAH7275405.1 hypothetical protein B0J15DRAFT_14768 [Fusarium solani]